MNEDIEKIISFATYAPSGENCQPWKFKVQDNNIFIYNLPERDTSLYSWGQRSSYFAHGSLIENMVIVSGTLGYELEIKLFPDEKEENLIAYVKLSKTKTKDDSLFSLITKRCTNRKPYESTPLTPNQKEILQNAADSIEPGHLRFIDDPAKISLLAQFTSLSERLVFENKFLHDFFFSHINWTKGEDRKKSIGFYLPTLELPPPAKIAFGLVKNWKILNILNKIGFPKTIAKENSKTHRAAGAHGIIFISDTRKESFVLAGRMMQRLWLTATDLNLQLQPMTGIFYLYLKIQAGETSTFNLLQINLINKAYENITSIFGLRDQVIPMYFRIGIGDEPSARSSRLPFEIFPIK